MDRPSGKILSQKVVGSLNCFGILNDMDSYDSSPSSGQSDKHSPNVQTTAAELLNEMQVVHSIEARHAAQHGDLNALLRLLDSGQATPDSVDSDDCSLLHWAAINNRLEIARLLIERKCNVNAIGGVLSSTPLHWASRHGHLQMVSLLIKNGANWSLKDVEGFTPLHIAVQFGCTSVAAFLIAVGQSPDELDDTRMTPAMWAAYKVYSVHPLRMLATMGADLEKSDGNYSNTALHWAVVQGNHTAVNTLLKLGVNMEPINKDKETPLDIAHRKNDLLAIRLIEMALRERNILPSNWKQRFDEDKKIKHNILFCIPFLTTFFAGFVFDSSTDYLSKAELLTLLCIFVALVVRHFAKEQRELGLQALFFGAAISSKLFFIIGWLVFLHPIVPFFMQILFLVLIVAVPFLFFRIFYSDPGFITATHKERCRMIISMTEDESWSEKFCSVCLILKPHGAKHCRICNRCVLQFDHHCPWVSNCVGVINHKLFVVYLLLLNLSTALVFVGCLYYWYDVCGQISYVNVVFCKSWVTLLHIYSFFFFFWTSMMSCIQGYELFMAKTNPNQRHRRCRPFRFGGNQFSIRCPFSRNCLRALCTLRLTSINGDSDFELNTSQSSNSYTADVLKV